MSDLNELAANLIMRDANRSTDKFATVVRAYGGFLHGDLTVGQRKAYDVEFPSVVEASCYASGARSEFFSVTMLSEIRCSCNFH